MNEKMTRLDEIDWILLGLRSDPDKSNDWSAEERYYVWDRERECRKMSLVSSLRTFRQRLVTATESLEKDMSCDIATFLAENVEQLNVLVSHFDKWEEEKPY